MVGEAGETSSSKLLGVAINGGGWQNVLSSTAPYILAIVQKSFQSFSLTVIIIGTTFDYVVNDSDGTSLHSSANLATKVLGLGRIVPSSFEINKQEGIAVRVFKHPIFQYELLR